MIPLVLIFLITGLSIKLACQLSIEVTWFTYYLGSVTGLFLSGCTLELWTRRKKGSYERRKHAPLEQGL
jgi:hypothetical protein